VRDPSKQPVPILVNPVVQDLRKITPKTDVYEDTEVVETDVESGDTSWTIKNNRPFWTSRTNFAMPGGILLDTNQDPTYLPFAFMPDVQTMFRTGRGSTYAINGNGQAIRNRSGKNHASKTTGLEPVSDEIYFFHPKDNNAVTGIRQFAKQFLDENIPHDIVVFSDDTGALSIGLVVLEDQYLEDGTLLREKGSITRAAPISRTPAVGLSPFDVFRKDDGTIEDSHLGNAITEIVQSPDTPLYDFPGMPVPVPPRSRKTTPSPASNRAIPIPTDPLANTNRILTDSSSPDANTPQPVVIGNNGKEYPDSEVYRASDAFIKSGSKYFYEENFVDFDRLISEAKTPAQREYIEDVKTQFLKMAEKVADLESEGFDGRPITTASAIKNIEKYSELVEQMLDELEEELSPEMKKTIATNAVDVIEKYGKTYNKEWSAGKKENNKRPSRQHALDENLSDATARAIRYWNDITSQYKKLANPTESVQSGSAINSAATINPISPIETIIRTPKASFDAFDDESKEEINQLTQQWLNASTQEQNIEILKRLAQIYTSQALSRNITPTERYRLYNDMIQFDDAQIDAIAKSDLSETEKRKQTNRVQNNRDNKLGIQDVILESNPEASVLPTDSNETPVVAPSSTPDATSTTSDTATDSANNTFSDNPPTVVGQRSPLQSIIPNPQVSFDNFNDETKTEINQLTQQWLSSQTKEQNFRILDRLVDIYMRRIYENVSPAEKYAIYDDLLQITNAMPNAVAASNMPETSKRRWLVTINQRRNEYREIQSNLIQQSRLI
jgi:hypothetical protein